MSTRSNQRFQFAFTIALSLHALAALAMLGYSHSLSSETLVANVMKMNWEVENVSAPRPRPTLAKAIPEKGQTSPQISAPNPAMPNPATPNPVIMDNYLSAIRDRLGNAIHLHQPRGTVNSQLVLKLSIRSSGLVSQTEIEKSSEHPEVDRAVLAAFESLLPLAPFPAEWKKTADSPEMITVRIPVVIRPRN